MVAASTPLDYVCRMKTALVCALLVAAACGGSNTEAGEPETVKNSGEKSPALSEEDQKLARFETQKQGTCEPMCERLTECAIEDLRANKSPQEVAKMELDKIAPLHTDDCNQKCKASDVSPRQLQVVRDCLGQPLQCPQFRECLAAANKQ